MKGRHSAVVTLLLAASAWASLAEAESPDEFRPPANLKVDPSVQPVVDRMWQASPTFHRQCQRLAAETSLQVTVSRDDQPTRSSFANARTALTFERDVLVTARVYLKTLTNAPELIAHELEHVIEQLDHVDLAAQTGTGAVWRSDRASFETRRAIEIGRRVAREIMDSPRERELVKRGSAERGGLATTLRLRDRDATPVSERTVRLSGDGRYVAFISAANLVDHDRNSHGDVYVSEIATGRTTLESVAADGTASDGASANLSVSGDGRYVVFESLAGNLTTDPFAPGSAQIFLRDRAFGVTRLLTVTAHGMPANGPSRHPVISADGTAVAFESAATDLGDSREGYPGAVRIYVMRIPSGKLARLDVSTEASDWAGSSMSPAIDADGRHVVFASKPNRNQLTDVYLYDADSNTTTRISRNAGGGDLNGASYDPAISGDGRFVTFVSEASNLVAESKDRTPQIYLHNLATGATSLISRTPSSRAANGRSLRPALSFDGSLVVFQSLATNLLCERKCPEALDDINLLWDVFVLDVRTNRMARLSADDHDEWMENSRTPTIDAAGRLVAFGSRHPIDVTDIADDEDLYVMRIEPASVLSTRQPK